MGLDYKARWRLFEALGYARTIETPHFGTLDYPVPVVRQFHDSSARIKICLAPARTSKSFSAAYDLIPDILDFAKPEKCLIFGPDYDKVSKEFSYIADALIHNRKKHGLKVPDPVVYEFSPKAGRMLIRWPWGAELHGKSGKQGVVSVLGESWGPTILSEACELDPVTWYRGLSTRVSRAILPTTPGVRGLWVKDIWDKGCAVGDSSVALFQYPPEANPFYDVPRMREELKRRGPNDPYFREQFLGEWAFYGGRVFPDFQPDPVEDISPWLDPEKGILGGEGRHCIAPFEVPRTWKRIAGMDFGWKDPTVHLWMAIAPNGDVIVYDEYYQPQRSTSHHIAEIQKQHLLNGSPEIADRLREPHGGQAAQLSQDYVHAGIWSRPMETSDRLSSRTHVQHYLDRRPSDGLPSLRIVKDRCPNLVRELLALHYSDPETHVEGRKETWRGDDHAVDALRYGLSSRPSPAFIAATTQYDGWTLDDLKRRTRNAARRMGRIHAQAVGDTAVTQHRDGPWWRYV